MILRNPPTLTTTVFCPGRFCNHLIRNLCTSFVAEKNDLYVEYSFAKEIKELGIELFVGKNKPSQGILFNEMNFFQVFAQPVNANLQFDDNCYFQKEPIIDYLYDYLQDPRIQSKIRAANPFHKRYQNNNDCFVHVRLGDVAWVTEREPGYDYYDKVISSIDYANLYIASDQFEHEICQRLLAKFPNASFLRKGEVQTIQFGSTCKNIVLSHGSFSATIGFLGYDSKVYCPKFDAEVLWSGNMFSIPSWKKIEYRKVIDVQEKLNYMALPNKIT